MHHKENKPRTSLTGSSTTEQASKSTQPSNSLDEQDLTSDAGLLSRFRLGAGLAVTSALLFAGSNSVDAQLLEGAGLKIAVDKNATAIASQHPKWRAQLHKAQVDLIQKRVNATYIADTIYGEMQRIKAYLSGNTNLTSSDAVTVPYLLQTEVIKGMPQSRESLRCEGFLLGNQLDALIRCGTIWFGAKVNDAVYDDLKPMGSDETKLLALLRSDDTQTIATFLANTAAQRMKGNDTLAHIKTLNLNKEAQEALRAAFADMQASVPNLHNYSRQSLKNNEGHMSESTRHALLRTATTILNIFDGKLDDINGGLFPDENLTVSAAVIPGKK